MSDGGITHPPRTPLCGGGAVVLTELGVHNSSVLLTNATIWVEGITDRLFIRHFLGILQKELPASQRVREDVHFSFVEYGGSAIDHWSFLCARNETPRIDVTRLCGKLFLIADHARDREG